MTATVATSRKIALLGVPSSAGARVAGQEQAPRALRRAGLVEQLRSRGHDVLDLGDLTESVYTPDEAAPKQQNAGRVRQVADEVVDGVHRALASDALPLVLGGDCTVTLGVLAALCERPSELSLLYFDSDLDLNTPQTTLSGILDGMVLAHVLGRGCEELSRLGSRHPLLEEEQVTLFGYSVEAGGIDPVELALLPTSAMKRYPRERVSADPAAAAEEARRELEGRAESILVHFDVDSLDFDEFPAVDVPHRPGLTLAEARAALAVLLASPKLVGLVVTEFNAAMDPGGELAGRLSELLAGVIPSGAAASTPRAGQDEPRAGGDG